MKQSINEEYCDKYNGTVSIIEQMKHLSHKLIGAINQWELQEVYGDQHSNVDATMAKMRNFALDVDGKCKVLLSELNGIT